jgi:hypothetical protein
MQILPVWLPVACDMNKIDGNLPASGGHLGTICMRLAVTRVQFACDCVSVQIARLHNFLYLTFHEIYETKVRLKTMLKGTVSEIFCFRFFHESPSPKPLIITLESFRIFSKIRGDIRKSRCTTGVNDTGGKFATGAIDTGGK